MRKSIVKLVRVLGESRVKEKGEEESREVG